MRRTLHLLRGPRPGPTLVCLAGLHGNEPAGIQALEAVGGALERTAVRESGLTEEGLVRGDLLALAGNLPALARGVRYVDRDLNRIWLESDDAMDTEAREREALREALRDARDRARGPLYLLDLHTTSGVGPPFTAASDTLAARALAMSLPVPMVLGLAESLPGTLVHALAGSGVAGAAFEAGPHEDPASPERAADAVWVVLAALGMIPAGSPRAREGRRRLLAHGQGYPRALHLVHAHPLREERAFRMQPGFRSFQTVRRGEVLARDREGEVRVPVSGRLIMPLYQERGEEGFFVGRAVRPAWLRISAALRRRRPERWLRFVPGVEADHGRKATIRVHPTLLKVVPPSVFLMLGYRARLRDRGRVVMTRHPEPGEGA